MALAVATDDDLAALRSAVQPVYDEIASDPSERRMARTRSRRSKRRSTRRPPPLSALNPASTVALEAGGFPNGTFVTTGITAEDIDRACGSGAAENLEQEEVDASHDRVRALRERSPPSNSFRSTTEPSNSARSGPPTPWFATASRSSKWVPRRRSRSTGRSMARSSSCPIPPTTPAIARATQVWVAPVGALRAHNAGDHRSDIGPDHARPDKMRVRLAMRAELSSRSAAGRRRHTTTSWSAVADESAASGTARSNVTNRPLPMDHRRAPTSARLTRPALAPGLATRIGVTRRPTANQHHPRPGSR